MSAMLVGGVGVRIGLGRWNRISGFPREGSVLSAVAGPLEGA